MLDLSPLLRRQQIHHALGRRAARHGVDLAPAVRRVQQRAARVEAGDAVGAGDDGRQVGEGGVELREVVVDAALAERLVLGSHVGEEWVVRKALVRVVCEGKQAVSDTVCFRA